jgi:hypothetical protein
MTQATSSDQKEEACWTSLWKVKIPSKIRVFIWRLAKQSIPTGDVRHRRNMALDSSCGICGATDSWRHSLLECRMSRCVWALVPEEITEHMDRTTEPNAKQWIFQMMSTLNHSELIRCFVTLWAIWFARRKVIHENIFQSPLSTYNFVESSIRDLEMAAPVQQGLHRRRRDEPAPRWIAPPTGYAKINVDAAVQKQRFSGAVAAVCRGQDSVFLGASALSIQGISDPGSLEAVACDTSPTYL